MFRPGSITNRDNDFRWVEWLLARIPGPKIDSIDLGYAMYHHAIEKALELKEMESIGQ